MNKTELQKIEAALVRERRKKYRLKTQTEYFLRFIEKYHRPLLQAIADRYKGRGVFPAYPEYLLPSFYDEKADMEIAALAGMLVDDVTQMREVMGGHPAEWFRRRNFVLLSMGDTQNGRTGGALNWRISAFFNELHDLTLGGRVGIMQSFLGESARMAVTLESAIMETARVAGVELNPIRLRTALAVLSPSEGIGLSIWDNCPFKAQNPLTSDVVRFLGYWWPEKPNAVSVDDAISMFGLAGDLDFLYASLGWDEMVKADRAKCLQYVKYYQLWFKKGGMKRPYRWRDALPEVSF